MERLALVIRPGTLLHVKIPKHVRANQHKKPVFFAGPMPKHGPPVPRVKSFVHILACSDPIPVGCAQRDIEYTMRSFLGDLHRVTYGDDQTRTKVSTRAMRDPFVSSQNRVAFYGLWIDQPCLLLYVEQRKPKRFALEAIVEFKDIKMVIDGRRNSSWQELLRHAPQLVPPF